MDHPEEVTTPMAQALGFVLAYYNHFFAPPDEPALLKDVRLVWFSKTLKNWKAMVITLFPDDMYFEITHDGEKEKTYLDLYKKVDNVELDDSTWK